MKDIRPVTLNIIATAAHIFSGCLIVTLALMYSTKTTALWVTGIWCVIIAIKEYWLDAMIETNEEAGSGWFDWMGCMIGAGSGWLIYLIFK